MRKVLVLGSGGAGKTTFAKDLAARTGLPLVHLDSIFWRPDWKEMPKPEWASTVQRLLQEPAWIMDGNYGGTLALRLAACDVAVLLDLPPWLCLWRVLKRRLQHRGRPRPEMPAGCPERLDAAFLWWVATYRAKRLPDVLVKLRAAEHAGKALSILRSPSETARFVSEAPAGRPVDPMLPRESA